MSRLASRKSSWARIRAINFYLTVHGIINIYSLYWTILDHDVEGNPHSNLLYFRIESLEWWFCKKSYENQVKVYKVNTLERSQPLNFTTVKMTIFTWKYVIVFLFLFKNRLLDRRGIETVSICTDQKVYLTILLSKKERKVFPRLNPSIII